MVKLTELSADRITHLPILSQLHRSMEYTFKIEQINFVSIIPQNTLSKIKQCTCPSIRSNSNHVHGRNEIQT